MKIIRNKIIFISYYRNLDFLATRVRKPFESRMRLCRISGTCNGFPNETNVYNRINY